MIQNVCDSPLDSFLPFKPLYRIVHDRLDPQSTPNKPLHGESNFGDSSGPFFSIYSKAADDEDNKMVERWQKDADGILIFVSPRVSIHISLRINRDIIDWSILRSSRCAPFCNSPVPDAKQSGYLSILPWEHLRGPRRTERNTRIYPFSRRQTTEVLTSGVCDLGELTVVFKPGHQPDVRSVGNISTPMVTSIHQGRSTGTVQSRETSTNACILCRWRGQDAYPLGS